MDQSVEPLNMVVTSPDWAAIAAAYCAGEDSVVKICAHFGIQSRALYKKAKSEGWPLRKTILGKTGAARKASTQKSGKTAKNKSKKSKTLPVKLRRVKMLARMYELLDQKLRFIEERHDMAQEMNASDRERDARTLTALVRLFEKLTEIDEQTEANFQTRKERDPSENGQSDNSKIHNSKNDQLRSNDDTERLRSDLARRLAKVHGQGN